MFCKNCGKKNDEGVKFCSSCGTKMTDGKNNLNKKTIDKEENKTSDKIEGKNTIKCLNCNYIGVGKSGRSIWAQILALLCLCFAPLITFIYFIATPRLVCPKCNSKFVQDIDERGNVIKKRNPWLIILYILIGIATTAVIASIILVNITAYEQKANGTTQQTNSWQTYNSVADQFSVDVPSYPTMSSEDNISAENGNASDTYGYHFYTSEKGDASFYITTYIYSYQIDTSNEDQLLERMLNNFISGSGGKLVSSNYTYYSSYRALDFLAQVESKFVKGRAIIARRAPYFLMYEYPSLSYIDADYQKFINSFKIK